ncbi:hypothetical protein D3C71_1733120 [compost metagenome]
MLLHSSTKRLQRIHLAQRGWAGQIQSHVVLLVFTALVRNASADQLGHWQLVAGEAGNAGNEGLGVLRDAVATPGDMLVGTDQYQAVLVQVAGLGVIQLEHL